MDYKLSAFSLSLFMSQLHEIIHQKPKTCMGPSSSILHIHVQKPSCWPVKPQHVICNPSQEKQIQRRDPSSPWKQTLVCLHRKFPASCSQTMIWNREYRFLVGMSPLFWDFLSFLAEPCLEQDQRNPVKYGLLQRSGCPPLRLSWVKV